MTAPNAMTAGQSAGAVLLHQLIDVTASCHPERPGLRCGTELRSWRQLRDDSVGLAAQLAGFGVRRGMRVLIVLEPAVVIPGLLFGCSRIGAVFVPLSPNIAEPVLHHVLTDCEPTLVITAEPRVRAVAEAHGVPALSPAELAAGQPGPAATAGPIPVDPACFLYTSGSTAMPKAVVCTHQQMTFVASAIQSRLGYQRDDVVFCALPLSFDYGLYQLFLCTLSGAQLYLADQRAAGHRLVTDLQDSRATVLPAVPSLAMNLNRLLERRPTALRLRLLTNTGAVLPPEVLAGLRARLPELRVQLMYGLTECKRATIMAPDEDLHHPGACGRALPGTEVFTVDAAGHRLPAGERGELVIRGPHVMAGYWRQPELSSERFRLADGLFPQLHSGDYGWLDEQGYLFFDGRRDDVYKQGGFRVSTVEVEAAAHRIAGVQAAIVVPPTGSADGAVLLVQAELTADQVMRELRRQIDEVKLPSRILSLTDFPLNSNGKVERRYLGELVRTGQLD
ncbi:MAG TPA: AMP-binding protein [Jatrophihabitans sp.]|nr:AMP-binding protein [Jatrophihabitans sp.]